MFERAGVAGVVVDVGAKDGSKRSLMGPDVRYVGVDPFVKTAPAMPGATLVRGVAEALPVRDGAADAVVSLASFDYYVDGAAAVDEMARVLRPGGCVAMLVSVVSPRVARARGASTRPLRAAYGLLSALDVGPVAAAGLAASAVLEPERPHTHYYTESQVQSFLSRRFDVAWHGETRQRTSTILYLAARKR
jgi:SAM-dependent methyltransferase